MSKILLVVDSAHVDHEWMKQSFADYTVVFSSATDPPKLPDDLAGAIVEASDETVAWHKLLRLRDVIRVYFAKDSPTLNETLYFEMQPLQSVEQAASELHGRLNTPFADETDAKFEMTLHGLVKSRLMSAMYLGDAAGFTKTWHQERYDEHLNTLQTTVCSPSLSKTKATVLDLASCVLAARLTEYFIRYRYSKPQEDDRTPPGLSAPIGSTRRLEIGWDGLFTLVYAFVDFIGKSKDVTFRFSELPEEPGWVALDVSEAPDFSQGPAEMKDLVDNYRDAAKHALHDGGGGKWRYLKKQNGAELQLRAVD